MVPMGSWGISGALGVPSFGFFSYFSPHFKLFLSSPIIVFYYLRLSFVPRTGTRLSRKQLWMLCPVTNARGKSQAGFISKITDTKKKNWENPCVLQPYHRNSPPFSVLALEDLKKNVPGVPSHGENHDSALNVHGWEMKFEVVRPRGDEWGLWLPSQFFQPLAGFLRLHFPATRAVFSALFKQSLSFSQSQGCRNCVFTQQSVNRRQTWICPPGEPRSFKERADSSPLEVQEQTS